MKEAINLNSCWYRVKKNYIDKIKVGVMQIEATIFGEFLHFSKIFESALVNAILSGKTEIHFVNCGKQTLCLCKVSLDCQVFCKWCPGGL